MPQEALEGGSKEILGSSYPIRHLRNFRAPQSRLRLLGLFLPLLKNQRGSRGSSRGENRDSDGARQGTGRERSPNAQRGYADRWGS